MRQGRKFTGRVSEPRKVTTRGGGTSYQIRYVGQDGRERSVNKPTLTEAVMEGKAIELALTKGADPHQGRRMAGPLMEAYIAESEADSETLRRRKALLVNMRLHVVPRWGAMPLNAITIDAIERWITDDLCNYVTRKGTPLAASSVRNVVAALSAFLTWARQQGYVVHNECLGMRSKAIPRLDRKVTIPTDNDVLALLAAMPDRYGLMVGIAAFACLRSGEVRGLRWRDIDAGRNRLLIAQQLTGGGDNAPPVFGPPKARQVGDDPEEVAVHPDLLSRLVEYRAQYAVDNRWDLVFTTETGRPLSRDKFNRIWCLARDRAGLHDVRFHDLRHYGVSKMLADRSVSIPEAAAQARHKDGGVLMMKVYAHVIGDDRNRSAHALRPSF